MEYNPAVVRREFVFCEGFGFGRLDERVFFCSALGSHAIGNDDIFEAEFLANIVIL